MAKRQILKSVSAQKAAGNKVHNSLSSVLKDLQRSKELAAGYADVLAALGMPSDGRITPAQLLDYCEPEQWVINLDKKGVEKERAIGVWGERQVRDEMTGEKLFEKDGVTPLMEQVCRKVTSWTPNKVFDVIADARVIKSRKSEVAAPLPGLGKCTPSINEDKESQKKAS